MFQISIFSFLLISILSAPFVEARVDWPPKAKPAYLVKGTKHFTESYSCRMQNAGPFKGIYTYGGSALFLTAYSEQMNSPELVFSGVCTGTPFIYTDFKNTIDAYARDITQASASSEDFPVNPDNTNLKERFEVREGRTYSLFVETLYARTQFEFTVLSLAPAGTMTIEYIVRSYVFDDRSKY